MNPIDLIKTQFEPMGLNNTQIKGALFFLAGMYSFYEEGSIEEENNKLYVYVEKSKFPEPYVDNYDESPSSFNLKHTISDSIFREIFYIYDKECKFGIIDIEGKDTEMVEWPSPLLFEEFYNQGLQLYQTHCLYVNICEEFGKLRQDRNEEEAYTDGARFWQETLPIWQKEAAPIMTLFKNYSPTWFQCFDSIPYVEEDFVAQTAPLQKYFHPLIKDLFEPDIASIEWAYSSWVCFYEGEMRDYLNDMDSEKFFEHTQSLMYEFKESNLNTQSASDILGQLPETFSEKLFSNISSDTDLFTYTQNFIYEFFGIPSESIELSSPLHEKLLWQSCMTHVNFCIGLKYDLLDS